jgi:hypothetical protein
MRPRLVCLARRQVSYQQHISFTIFYMLMPPVLKPSAFGAKHYALNAVNP